MLGHFTCDLYTRDTNEKLENVKDRDDYLFGTEIKGCQCYAYRFDGDYNVAEQAIGYVNGWHCCCDRSNYQAFSFAHNPENYAEMKDFYDNPDDLSNERIHDKGDGWRFVGPK